VKQISNHDLRYALDQIRTELDEKLAAIAIEHRAAVLSDPPAGDSFFESGCNLFEYYIFSFRNKEHGALPGNHYLYFFKSRDLESFIDWTWSKRHSETESKATFQAKLLECCLYIRAVRSKLSKLERAALYSFMEFLWTKAAKNRF
jgi:hypothetical protein